MNTERELSNELLKIPRIMVSYSESTYRQFCSPDMLTEVRSVLTFVHCPRFVSVGPWKQPTAKTMSSYSEAHVSLDSITYTIGAF